MKLQIKHVKQYSILIEDSRFHSSAEEIVEEEEKAVLLMLRRVACR